MTALGVARIFVKGKIEWGSAASISKEDWGEIVKLLGQHGIGSILEFGAGFSTKKFCDSGIKIVSLETNARWAEIVSGKCPKAKIVLWDNKEFPKEEVGNGRFDLVFVDGVTPRDNQVIYGKEYSDKLLLHDTKRKQEQGLIAKYLSDWNATALSNGRLTFLERTS
jgi:hypothetical protein